MPKSCLLHLLFAALAAPAFAAEPAWTIGTAESLQQTATVPTGQNASAPVVRFAKAPTIDGNLAEWGDTVAVTSFPFAALQDRRSARLRFGYDDTALYVAGHVVDDTPMVNQHGPLDLQMLSGDVIRFGVDAGLPTEVILCPWGNDAELLKPEGRPHVFTGLKPYGGQTAMVKDPDGKGYIFEVKIPWAGVKGKPDAPNARLCWEIRWGDRTGQVATLVYPDGLAQAASGARDVMAEPSLWGSLRWLTAVQAKAEGRPPALSLPQIAYTLPSNAYVTVVIETPDGRRIRNLVAEAPRLGGDRREVWDGRDDAGKLVAAGSYRWRGLWHTGLSPEYLLSFNNPGHPPYITDNASSWGADHDAPVMVATNGGKMYLAWNNCEAGSSLICTDFTGRKQWGWRSDPALPWDTTALCADEKYVYLAKSGPAWNQWDTQGAAIARFDAATGGLVNWPAENGGVGAGTLRVREFSKEDKGKPYRLNGLSLSGNTLYLSMQLENKVEMRDATTGAVLGSLDLPAPGPSAVEATGSVLLVSGKQLVRLNPETKQAQPLHDFDQPHGVAVGAQGEVYVSDWGPNQVVVLDASGKELRRVGRAGGRGTVGPWLADGMLHPNGLAVDPTGRLWVAEKDWWPKRFSVWAADGRLAMDFIGPTPYGCVTSYLDPDDHTVGYSSGTKFALDYANKAYKPLAVLGRNDRPGAVFWWAEAGKFYTLKGKRYFINEGGAFTFKTVFLSEPDRLRALASVGVAKQLKDAYQGPELPSLQAAKDDDWFSWADQNGDALVQDNELQFLPSPSHAGFGTYWGGFPAPDLTMYWPSGGQMWQFPVTSWTAAGAPVYDLTKAHAFAPLLGEVGFLGVDAENRVLVRGQPIMAYRPDGSVDWTYPSEFAMHGHPGPPAPGRIVEVHRIPGIADLPRAAGGQLYAMNGNDGEWYFLTTDGLFVQHIFNDIRVGGWRAPEYVISQEAFGGYFVKAADDGKYYVIAGHTDARVFRLDGVDSLRRFAAKPVDLSGAAYTAAQQVLAQETFARKAEKSARLPRLAGPAPPDGFVTAWPEGSLTEWTALNGAQVRVRKAWDPQALYLRYEVQDNSPLKNNGDDWKLLFKYGDSVDLQIGADPNADPRRAAPVAGDERLLITEAKGTPYAVLYQPVVPDYKGPKVPFASPNRTLMLDRVSEITEQIRLRLTRQANAYVVEAAVPWSLLGITPRPGMRLRADFGVLFGNDAGEVTLLRSYWSNENTTIVSDVPSEATLEPRQWGELTVE
jgi:hypothetical protein